MLLSEENCSRSCAKDNETFDIPCYNTVVATCVSKEKFKRTGVKAMPPDASLTQMQPIVDQRINGVLKCHIRTPGEKQEMMRLGRYRALHSKADNQKSKI
jgi:hypothetical protein